MIHKLRFSFPFARWLPEYQQPGVVRADLLAGLTGAIVVLPQGIAFALLAGMPPHYGLYAAMVPCIIAALFGSSRLMVTGPANAISLTTMALIAPLAIPESEHYVVLVLTLSFLIGVIQIALGLGGAGKWVEKVPHSVIVGFTAGAAVLIINSQVGTLLGIEIARGTNVLETIKQASAAIYQGQWRPQVLTLVLITLVTMRLWKPLNRWIPAMLVAVIVGSIALVVLERYVAEFAGIRKVSAIPGALPPLSYPVLSLEHLQLLFGPVLVMTLLASTEAMAIARALALKRNDAFDANQEFIGQGLANVGGSFFSAYPSSGSFNRSGVNLAANAQTPLAAICAAVFLLVILIFVSPLAEYLPYAVIAALLLAVAWNLIDLGQIRHEFRSGAHEWIPMVITGVGTVTISLEWAVLAGICSAAIAKRIHGSAK
ncbi:MAG: SulP family inorganic anion transporter [Burkholderiaceae bacterium]|nr:SulP family inorganic anion transporter [Burkholderiaceae bacterium]NCZ80479.1 SulP family inorganic anion transporter [Burkholderiaceae bacterium]NDA16072.1 SulP family inorganic anion transporter [Burkholderiaceae bacterium]NDC50996.1 SulP family inorganic anion transporter [Burkholderiaceae bacterium]NDI21150.1 SulP family inorganic anion transporter [Burkholderiaceae bacterium]